ITRPSRSDEPGDVQIEAIHGEGDLSGPVRNCAGPWRVQEGWWSTTPADRDYWDIELSRGSSYRVYREESQKEWFVDAAYG
ncbi:MAG TPA: hypothetical protein VF911_08555, partial [Thermoanaerobaculia bacterium]